MQLFAKFKKILRRGFRAALNFRKFKVGKPDLGPKVSHLTTPWGERGTLGTRLGQTMAQLLQAKHQSPVCPFIHLRDEKRFETREEKCDAWPFYVHL